MNICKNINCGERSEAMIFHRSYTHNLSRSQIKAWKNHASSLIVKLSKARRNFGDEVTVLPRVALLVSSGNNIATYNFAHFAANDVKRRQVATGNVASFSW